MAVYLECVILVVFYMVQLTYQRIVFRKIPVRMTIYGDTLLYNLTVSDPNECATVGAPDPNANIIKYYQDSGYCEIWEYGTSYSLATTAVQYNGTATFTMYLRTHSICTCADGESAERMMVDFVYFENPCIPRYSIAYDKVTKYCVGQSSAQGSSSYANGYGLWRVGVTSNYTLYYLTRAQATQMAKYTCTGVRSYRVPYNDTWYCMGINQVSPNNFSLWSNNYCGQYLQGGYGSKFVHPLVYGFLYVFTSANAVTGLTTYDGTNYVYNDNTTVPSSVTLPWKSGYPQGNPYVFVTSTLELQDFATNDNNYITCMGPVQSR